jgi:hypothetical protein
MKLSLVVLIIQGCIIRFIQYLSLKKLLTSSWHRPRIYSKVVQYCRLKDIFNFFGDARHPPILARTPQIAHWFIAQEGQIGTKCSKSWTYDIRAIPDVYRTYTNLIESSGQSLYHTVYNLHRFHFATMKHICFILNQLNLTEFMHLFVGAKYLTHRSIHVYLEAF